MFADLIGLSLSLSFQSLKMEIVHGAPSSSKYYGVQQLMRRSSVNGKTQIKMYQTQFDLTDKDLSCAGHLVENIHSC
jgi:hypothetical protein